MNEEKLLEHVKALKVGIKNNLLKKMFSRTSSTLDLGLYQSKAGEVHSTLGMLPFYGFSHGSQEASPQFPAGAQERFE